MWRYTYLKAEICRVFCGGGIVLNVDIFQHEIQRGFWEQQLLFCELQNEASLFCVMDWGCSEVTSERQEETKHTEKH